MYKKLLSNSIIFTIGNFGSKLLLVILVPIYTFYLTPAEFGVIDLLTTTANLLLPIVTLNIFEAILRFSMEKDESKASVLMNSLMIQVFLFFIFLCISLLLSTFKSINSSQMMFLFLIIITQGVQLSLAQFARGIGKIKIYAVSGILLTLVTGIANIIFVVVLKEGIAGYLLSIVLGNVLSAIFLGLAIKVWTYLKMSYIDKSLLKKMVIFSVPLIPNTIMWWAMNALSRYFVLYFLGTAANGILAVANKIPSVVSLVNSVFFQAWQMSAIEEYDSESKSKFYSEVFKYFSIVMFVFSSGFLFILKPLLLNVLSSEYATAWQFVPFMLISVVYSSFASFLGTNYIAAKQTTGVFSSSIIGALVCTISNLVLIPLIGLNGVGLGSMLGFFIMFVIRVYDTQKFVEMKIDISNFAFNHIIIFMQIGLLYYFNSWLLLLLEFICLLAVLVVNRNMFLAIFNRVKKVTK